MDYSNGGIWNYCVWNANVDLFRNKGTFSHESGSRSGKSSVPGSPESSFTE